MFFIRKKLPRSHAPGEPLLHANHKRPVTRRELLGAGLATAPAVVVGPAWLAAALRPNSAHAATLSSDIQALLAPSQCNVARNTGASRRTSPSKRGSTELLRAIRPVTDIRPLPGNCARPSRSIRN